MQRHYLISAFLLVLLCSCQTQKEEEKNSHKELVVNNISFPTAEGLSYGEPFLYTDAKGKTFLSWRESQNKVHQLRYAELEGDRWTDPQTIASGENWFVNWADYPQLVSLSQGDLLSFFLEKSGEAVYAYDIKLISSQDDWTSPKVLHDDGKKVEHGFVSMIPYEDNAFVAWLDGRNTIGEETNHDEHTQHGHSGKGAMSLRGAILDKKGNKQQEWELDASVCDCCQTTASMTDNGPVVIYRSRSVTEVRDISIVRYVDGEWTAAEPIFDDNWKIKGCPVNGPRSDAMGNNLGIAWFAERQGQAEVKVIFSEDGGATFLPPVKINEGHTIGRVDLIMLDENSAMVSWMEGADILTRKVSKDGSLSPITVIATSAEHRSSGFPQMSKSNKQLIFAWTDSQGPISLIKTAIVNL